MANIQPYRRALAESEARFRLALAAGKTSAFDLALLRVTLADHADRTHHRSGVGPRLGPHGPDPKSGFTGPSGGRSPPWRRPASRSNPEYGSPEQLARKWEEYLDLKLEMRNWGQVKEQLIEDKQQGKAYLVFGANPLVARIMELISNALMEWFDDQPNTAELIDNSAIVGLARMLSERPDLVMLLRLSERLPLDVEVGNIPVDRPAMAEAVEFAIGLIPVVGNVVAAYEAWSGVDLFGYHLSDVERGILAASVLLPAAGRLVKGRRALYTEARLVALYGRDAASWSRSVGAGARGLADRQALSTIGRAERTLLVDRKITGSLLRESADAVPRVAKGTPALTTTS